MTEFLNMTEESLRANGAYWTAREIAQQPAAWRKVCTDVAAQRTALDAWLEGVLAHEGLRIILTGAGTSAYVGKALAPHLSKALSRRVEDISTTDIVANPDGWLLRDKPTLLISYARSGNSPESVGAYELADQIVENCFHLVIVCNKEGALAKAARQAANSYCLLMPEETLDQSFAMTSSYTSMLVATLCVFTGCDAQLEAAAAATEQLVANGQDDIRALARTGFKRIAYLGSGALMGVATEAALKMLELSAGRVDCYAESPLGFRHGPKSMVDDTAVVVVLPSSDAYTRKYDSDLIAELRRDNQFKALRDLSELPALQGANMGDIWLGLPYIAYCQMLAFYTSLAHDVTPDNPCPSGEVNRVVQGVAIYGFEG
ncbi:SIS domain-containing protein [Kordiimonas sp.]|uniref:SIS domain-containing protein n=1 Tax=Kordiimonas sp. TaxID=1970157 RepID=UPI003A8D0592